MSLTITAASLKDFASSCDAAGLAPPLEAARARYGLDTAHRLCHFMGQIYHESGGLTHLIENLDYSPAALMKAWPKRFPNLQATTPYAHNPPALANYVYGGRLGNTQPGDGWRYRGRGFIQLTGKANYRDASTWSGLDLVADPDLASQPDGASTIAAAFWAHKGLNAVADGPNEAAAIRQETLIINGGTLGLDERAAAIARAEQIWS